jgi:hypothetical protein
MQTKTVFIGGLIMWNWQNNDANGIPYSRYVASYYKICHDMRVTPMYAHMYCWLDELVVNGEKLSEDDKRGICEMMDNGKMELEDHCRNWCKKQKNWYKEHFNL